MCRVTVCSPGAKRPSHRRLIQHAGVDGVVLLAPFGARRIRLVKAEPSSLAVVLEGVQRVEAKALVRPQNIHEWVLLASASPSAALVEKGERAAGMYLLAAPPPLLSTS